MTVSNMRRNLLGTTLLVLLLAALLLPVTRLLSGGQDLYTRDNPVAHLTASSWVVSPDRKQVLLIYHNLYRSWAWMGGHADGDRDLCRVALRETREELGIRPENLDVIGLLDFLYLRSDALMHPVLARVDAHALTCMHPNPDEVADTFLVPVQWLTEHPPTLYRYPLRPMIGADFPYDTVQRDNSYPWEDGRMEVPVYEGLPYPLWGLTARITYYLLKDVPS